MKFNQIAIASMLLVAGSSFAATANCTASYNSASSAADFVNNCAPDMTLFIGGSSAMGSSIGATITSAGYFTSAPIIVYDGASPNGLGKAAVDVKGANNNGGKAGNGVSAWYGIANPVYANGKTGQKLLVIFNGYNGSAAGVSNVLATDPTGIPEADVVSVGPIGTEANTCTSKVKDDVLPVFGSTTGVTVPDLKGSFAVHCTAASSKKHADIAISDVDVTELLELYPTATTSLTKVVRTPLAMQGFAIAVNNTFYSDLQTEQLKPGGFLYGARKTSDGTTWTDCAAGDYALQCQPNITSAQYASLVTKEGKIKSAAGFIPGSTKTLTLARRDQLSGTQATSNMFFASEICNALDSKSKVNTHGGALTALRSTDTSLYDPAKLTVNENVQTSSVESDLKTPTTDYSIGMIALSKAGSSTTGYKFVKLDGASPNFKAVATPKASPETGYTYSVGQLDGSTLRNNMIDGSWPLQVTAYAVYLAADVTAYNAKKNTGVKSTIIKALVADLSDASRSDLAGIGYFNGGADKKTQFMRVAKATGTTPVVNNCAPLISYSK